VLGYAGNKSKDGRAARARLKAERRWDEFAAIM
jgi:hypothetical protein